MNISKLVTAGLTVAALIYTVCPALAGTTPLVYTVPTTTVTISSLTADTFSGTQVASLLSQATFNTTTGLSDGAGYLDTLVYRQTNGDLTFYYKIDQVANYSPNDGLHQLSATGFEVGGSSVYTAVGYVDATSSPAWSLSNPLDGDNVLATAGNIATAVGDSKNEVDFNVNESTGISGIGAGNQSVWLEVVTTSTAWREVTDSITNGNGHDVYALAAAAPEPAAITVLAFLGLALVGLMARARRNRLVTLA